MKLISNNTFHCPICQGDFRVSDYLGELFKEDDKALWLSNMVTHYRHNHITSWNKCWGYGGGRYRRNWFGNYDDEKQKVNERAKRQIVRKASAYLLEHQIGLDTFGKLQGNSEETIKLVQKIIGK